MASFGGGYTRKDARPPRWLLLLVALVFILFIVVLVMRAG
jgi:hypothetical protein